MDTSKSFIMGFNSGYVLQKFEPKLTDDLIAGLESEGEYEQGFQAGSREFLQEKEKERLNQLKNLKGKDTRDIDRR